jgi:hypothetical protein
VSPTPFATVCPHQCANCGRRYSRAATADGCCGTLAAAEPDVVTDGGRLEVCPSCDAADIVRRLGGMTGPEPTAGDVDAEFRCQRCGATFDEPTVREPHSGQPVATSALTKQLAEADPDDLVTDGGVDQGLAFTRYWPRPENGKGIVFSTPDDTIGAYDPQEMPEGRVEWLTGVSPARLRAWATLVAFCNPDSRVVGIGVLRGPDGNDVSLVAAGLETEIPDRLLGLATRMPDANFEGAWPLADFETPLDREAADPDVATDGGRREWRCSSCDDSVSVEYLEDGVCVGCKYGGRQRVVTDGGRPVTDGGRISVDELTDEQIERVLNSRGFQKMLAYNKLADGIDVLEEEDEIYDSMITTITKQHTSVSTEASVREVLTLFRQEIATFTEPLVDEDGEESIESTDLEDLYVDDGGGR